MIIIRNFYHKRENQIISKFKLLIDKGGRPKPESHQASRLPVYKKFGA